jgi:cytochrome c peroxidase
MLPAAALVRAFFAAAVLAIGLLGTLFAYGYDGRPRGYGPAHLAPAVVQKPATGWGAGNPLVALGEKLFFDARLSGTGTTACASCHNPDYGFAQPRRVSKSDNGQLGRRNAPPLLDVGFLAPLMWDGRFGSLEQQAFGPFQSGEMGIGIGQAAQRVNADPQYVQLFHTAFGGPATPDGMARALAAFQRTLFSRESRVDRFLNNETGILNPQERHGYEIFTRRAGCANCHQPYPLQVGVSRNGRAVFTDLQFHNIGIGYNSGGVADAGRFEQSRNDADWGTFRTPSLRNSARTPPYMHDGSLATLEEVVEFYSAGGRPNPNISPLIRPLHLDGRDKAALVAFLRALGE